MRTRTTTSIGKKVTTALLALTMALGLAPGVALAEEVELEPQVAGKTVACLGTGGIAAKNDGKDQFSGSYVYYGTYNNESTKYRVLANGTTDFGGTTMLLDCDTVLATTAYGETRAWGTSESPSTLKSWTTIGDNGAFGAEGDKKGVFTAPEKAAIAESFTTTGEDPTATDKLGADFKLTGEQAFVLSAGEASAYYADNDARKKNGGHWWLRAAGAYPYDTCAAFVRDVGNVRSDGWLVNDDNFGVSPAFNINLQSVIFSSLISGSDYKLTIKDAGLGASGTATLDGTKATVTYATTGDAATQASYLVTDKAWSDSDGWPADAQVLAYGMLGEAGKGEGSFELPGGCAADGWGSTYHVYVLAETVSEGNATDYASAPVEVTKPVPATYKVTVAEGIEGGTVTTDKDEAAEGDSVKITARADDGYELDTVTVTAADGRQIETKDGSFTMPASDVTVSATFAKKSAPAGGIKLTGLGHVQGIGDVAARASGDGVLIGTTGESRRLEQLTVSLPKDTNGSIEYRAHLQGTGWGEWVAGGKPCGTRGESRRIEAVQMELEGAGGLSVWYRVHSQTFGWLGWAKDGQAAGTAGQSRRAEAIEVQVLPKGQAPAGYEATQASYVGAATADVHLQGTGWAGAGSALGFGTTGQARRLEAIRLSAPNQPLAGGISYEVHAQGKGWMPAAADGALAGTTGESRRLVLPLI